MAANSSFSFNRTGRGNTIETSHKGELCPEVWNARFETFGTAVPYFVNAALNAQLAIVTTFANLLVLLAMRHVTSIRLPSKLLLCSLVVTDLGTGLVIQPQHAVFLFCEAIYPGLVQCVQLRLLRFTGSLFIGASLLTLLAIFLDRFAALFFHLKYQQIVTTRRVCAVLAVMWSLSLFAASTALWNYSLWRTLTLITIINFPLISIICIKIYRRLRAQQVQPQAPDQAQQQAGNILNMEKYRRTASAMMWVYVLFLLCYVPSMCSSTVTAVIGYTTLTVCLGEFCYTLVLLSSCLNPFIYCLRLPEVRSKVTKQLQKLCHRNTPQ